MRSVNTRLDHAARQLYNACLGDALRRVRLLRESRAYQQARALPKDDPDRNRLFDAARDTHGFTDDALQAYAIKIRRQAFPGHLDARTAQKLGTRAFTAADKYLRGRHGQPRFKGRRQLNTVEGKSNDGGIRWRTDHVEWLGLRLPAIIDPRDEVTTYALKQRVKYVRLVRRRLGS